MKHNFKLLLLIFSISARMFAYQKMVLNAYYDQEEFLENFENLDEKKWLSFQEWERILREREVNPHWKRDLYEVNHHEIMGRALFCEGECRSYGGLGFYQLESNSPLREGDNLVTSDNSVLWILLNDGRLIEMSPRTSLTLREINFSKKKWFFFWRVNYGLVVSLARDGKALPVNNLTPTDQFWVVKDSHLNNWQNLKEEKFELSKYLKTSMKNQAKVELVNQLISVNQAQIHFPQTESLIDFLHGHFLLNNQSFLIFVNPGQQSILKILDEEDSEKKVQYFFRGHNNLETKSLEIGRYYVTSKDGRELNEDEKIYQTFWPVELLSRRPYTFFLLREMNLKTTMPRFLNPHLDEFERDSKLGVRFWNELDMKKHLAFLLEFTRRTETTQLGITENYFAEEEDAVKAKFRWSRSYYQEYWLRYLHQLEKNRNLNN